MTVLAGKSTITPQELLALPDAVGYELVDGQLVERNVSVESSRVALEIGALLRNEARRTREATVFGSDLGYQCFPGEPNRVRKPDVSLIRNERLAGVPAGAGYMPIPADLAVELVSPHDLADEVIEKVEEYHRAGFPAIWVVHRTLKLVELYRPDGASLMLHENDSITAGPTLPGFRARVGEFFQA